MTDKTVNVVSDNIQLRDYFAGQALPGLIQTSSDKWEIYARASYDIADAMLKARAE